MKLKPGCGYFDTTVLPFGGDFCRADRQDGKEIAKISRIFSGVYGFNAEVVFSDGRRGALNLENCTPDDLGVRS